MGLKQWILTDAKPIDVQPNSRLACQITITEDLMVWWFAYR